MVRYWCPHNIIPFLYYKNKLFLFLKSFFKIFYMQQYIADNSDWCWGRDSAILECFPINENTCKQCDQLINYAFSFSFFWSRIICSTLSSMLHGPLLTFFACPISFVFFRPQLKIQAFGHWAAPKFDDPPFSMCLSIGTRKNNYLSYYFWPKWKSVTVEGGKEVIYI